MQCIAERRAASWLVAAAAPLYSWPASITMALQRGSARGRASGRAAAINAIERGAAAAGPGAGAAEKPP